MNHMAVPYTGGAYFNRSDLWQADIDKLKAADPATFRRGTVFLRNEETFLTAGMRMLFGYRAPPYYACGKGQILLGEVELSPVVVDHFAYLKKSRNFEYLYCMFFVRCFDSKARANLQQRAIDLVTATAPGTNLGQAAHLYGKRMKDRHDVTLFIACLNECHSLHPPVTASQVGAFAAVG